VCFYVKLLFLIDVLIPGIGFACFIFYNNKIQSLLVESWLNNKLAIEYLTGIDRESKGKFERVKESTVRLIDNFIVNLYFDS
jgi:hypothetical protein